MELNILNEQGQDAGKMAASDAVFGREYNEDLVHQLVIAYQANARLGTRAQLTREAVHHSTKKPWRQKGTGRARSGMTSSNIWRGGGRAFPNTPYENFSHKVNKKAYRAGMCTILSKLVADQRLFVVEDLKADTCKTKDFAAKLKAMGLTSVLVVTDALDDNTVLASNNLTKVYVAETREINPYSLVYFDKIVLTRAAVAKIEEMLG